jgi:membrane-bound serine protease (ClpP class)
VEWALSAVKESASVTAEKALELNVIDFLARDLDGFLKAADGRVVQTAAGQVTLSTASATQLESPMSSRQKFLSFLSDPNLVYILFAIGMMCLYLELSSPGAIVPAIVGGVSLLLALTGLTVLPYDATGLIFMVLAGVCFVAEAYITSFGLLALGGAASLVIGALLLFETPPELKDLKGLQVGVAPHVYGTTALIALLVAAAIGYLVTRAQLRKSVTGQEGLIGLEGVALTALGPQGGRILLRGEYWNARCAVPLPVGARVTVEKVNGLTVDVSPTG